MGTYEQYAQDSGLSVLEVKQAVRNLYSDHRRKAINRDVVASKRVREKTERCTKKQPNGRRCGYKGVYINAEGQIVCGIHKDRNTYVFRRVA